MKSTVKTLVFLLALALAAVGCNKGGAPDTTDHKPAASAKKAGTASRSPGVQDTNNESNEAAPAQTQGPRGQSATTEFKDAARDLVATVLDPCGTHDWESVAAALADTVEYNEWGYDRILPRDVFIKEVFKWRCEALASPEMYETIPVQQRIVDVFAAGPGGHKFAYEFHPPGTGVTQEEAMRCDHVTPPGQARVLVADRTLQGETLSWPPYGDWQGYMYYVKEIDGSLKIYKYGSCPADDTVELVSEGE